MSDSPTTDQIGENFSVQLQVGIIREAVTVAFYDLEPDGSQSPVSADVSKSTNGRYLALKETATAFVRRKFPEQRFVGLPNKLLLFLHQPSDPNILKLISPQTEVVDGCLIEIVLSGVATMDDLCARPHILNVHSYKTPHFCEFCGEMLWGLVKQGLKCDGCGLSFHKRCAYKIPNDCSASRNNNVRRPSMEEQHQNNSAQRNGSILNSPTIRRGSTMRLQIPHSFVAHNYTLPTVCQHCHKLLPLFRQNLQCKDCKFNCHKKCSETVPLNCQGESRWNVDSLENSLQEIDIEDSESPEISNDPKKESPMNNLADQISQDDEEDPKNLRNTKSSNIPLQRVVQSIKHTKRTGSQYIREGWMVCFTNRDSMRRHHYWRLDTKAITLFSDEKTKRYYKEICLKDIERLELVKQSSKLHVFEIQVGETVYYVGEDTGESKVVENGVGRERAVCFENAIRQAMLPLTPQSSNESSTAGSDKASVDVDDTPITDISQRYEIFPDDVLGSGQFGIVYGAIHKSKGHDVAIKVIDKLRFPNKQEAQLKNEVGILQNIHHPGVVNLEYMFESSDKIYVVMEKLKGDMLEMILSNPIGRLCERVTRFLVSQILMALKYLHFKHIVHCDLKPENVLLSSNSLFPQVKLCDFGFARIIGEKSFRRSVVGTPAYLAPEVLKNKGYNRSLDMWSVGVILYVSLSGTFPFNEDEDINDQIQNAAFMFPSNPWGQISLEAIDLITKILQVKLRSRFSVDRSLNHIWLQDYQCWCDLRMLESMLGKRYLTNDADEGHWERFRIEKKLPKWQDCGQKGLKEITKLNDKSAADGKGSTTA